MVIITISDSSPGQNSIRAILAHGGPAEAAEITRQARESHPDAIVTIPNASIHFGGEFNSTATIRAGRIIAVRTKSDG